MIGSTDAPPAPTTLEARGDVVWLAVGNAVVRSESRGDTWSVAGVVGAPVRALSFISDDDGWAATDAGLFRTADGGAGWSVVAATDDIPILDVEFADALHGWIARGDEVMRTADGGASWTSSGNVCGALEPRIAFSDARTAWAICPIMRGAGAEARDLHVTSDDGATWALYSWNTAFGNRYDEAPPPYDLPAGGYVTAIEFLGRTHGWLTGNRSALYLTTDGAKSWHRVEIPETTEPDTDSVAFVSPDHGYVLSQQQVWRTRDAGLTWEKVWGAALVPAIETVHPALKNLEAPRWVVYSYAETGDGTWWAVAGGGPTAMHIEPRVMSSKDEGEHWDVFEIPGVTPSFVHSQDGGSLLVRDHGAEYTSDDGGLTWTRVRLDLANIR